MKTKHQNPFAAFLVIIVLAGTVSNQAIASTIPGLYNTGVDSNGQLLPSYSADPHYMLIESADSLFPGPNTYIVDDTVYPFHSGRWFDDGPDSKWISIQAGNSANGALGTYVYRTTFDLTGFEYSKTVIEGQWSTDNPGMDILLNGLSTGHMTSSVSYMQWSSFHIESGFVPGINYLDFIVVNEGGPTGLRVETGGTAVPQSKLKEIASSEATLGEMIHIENSCLEDGNVVGDINGLFDFNSFEIVTVKTGPWAGKGFSKAQCQVILEGVTYTGEWQGVAFFKPDDANTIYLKGSITGEFLATGEGTLTESNSASGIYDKYQAVWKIGKTENTITSAIVNATGTLVNKNDSNYPNTNLYVLQTAMDGNLTGDYNEPLSIVINHVRIEDSNCPYDGNGFSIISYVSQTGSGQGYTCDQILSSGVVSMKGLFTDPLYGVLSAALNETTTPRTLYLSLQRIDLGLPPAPELKVKVWGPDRVSPGQTIDYIIEYRNDGLKAADDTIIFFALDPSVNYISSSMGGIYDEFYGEVSWNLGQVPPKIVGNMSVKVMVAWGLPWGTTLDNFSLILNMSITSNEVETSLHLQSSNKPSLYLGGVNNPIGSPNWEKATKFASEVKAQYCGIYVEGIWQDMQDVKKANPIFSIGGPNPELGDPQCVITDGEEIIYVYFTRNNNNGLTYPSVTDSFYDTVYAYSGGTRTALTALLYDDLICNRLVLIAPNAGTEFPNKSSYMWELVQVRKKHPGMEIVIYQSAKDGMVGGIRFGSEDKNWLEENNIKVNPGTEEFGFNDPIEVEVRLEDGTIVQKLINIDQKINSQGHAGLYSYITSKLIGKDEASSEASSSITPARDPSVKFGPEGNVLAGEKLNYRIEYENEGEGIAFGVYFTDTLSKDLNDAALEIGPIIDVNTSLEIAGPGVYNPATRTITWFAGEVGSGKGGYADVNVCVRSDAPDGTEIINYATIYFPSVPQETRTNGIVSIVSTNLPPVANAGPDQTVYAWIDGIADVNLDGSGSYDEDGDTLIYKWTWTIGGNVYEANGVKPTIELPVGQHTIELVVNDGLIDSEPNEVNITVIGPVKTNLCVMPKVINCKSFLPKIMTTMQLPKGITKDQIDTKQPLLLYPGAIEADRLWISREFDFKCRAWSTTILASFDEDELMDAIPDKGRVELVVVGRLKTGQYFYGTDTVNVICPGKWPWHRMPWWDHRWNRWCQKPFNCRH